MQEALEQSERLAYRMGLKPAEFWNMTPAQFRGYARGYNDRREYEQRLVAWHIAWTAQADYKGDLTVDKVLGNQEKSQIDEFNRTLDDLNRAAGVED